MVTYDRKVIFPAVKSLLCTDEAFDAMTDEEHHSSACPLKPLPIGYVTQFGLDYMQLACLGVMRRLSLYWKGPVGPLHVRLGRKFVSDLSARLLHMSQCVPFEFARRPRSLDEILRWKATEFREFLLYNGPVVLRHILHEDLYSHFILFLWACVYLYLGNFHCSTVTMLMSSLRNLSLMLRSCMEMISWFTMCIVYCI